MSKQNGPLPAMKASNSKATNEAPNRRATAMTSTKVTAEARSTKDALSKAKSNTKVSNAKTVPIPKQTSVKKPARSANDDVSVNKHRTIVTTTVRAKPNPATTAIMTPSSTSSKVASLTKTVLKRTESVPSKGGTKPKPSHRSDSQVKQVKLEPKHDGSHATHATAARIPARGPLKASHSVKVPTPINSNHQQLPNNMKPNANAASASVKNVMNQVHNVTVTSPPPVRREMNNADPMIAVEMANGPAHVINNGSDNNLHRRTRTRTLENDEIVFLKTGERVLAQTVVRPQFAGTDDAPLASVNVEVKQPISFEVNFDDDVENPNKTASNATALIQTDAPSGVPCPDEDEYDYEDDFDSYESDFESASATSSDSDSSGTSQDSSSAMAAESSGNDDADDGDRENYVAAGQPKNTVRSTGQSHRGEEERQLDSGAFELKPPDIGGHSQYGANSVDDINSFDGRDTFSETQNDSGIEYNVHVKSPTFGDRKMAETTDAIEMPIKMNGATGVSAKQSVLDRRGNELMKKISLDTMSYVLFDFKPIAYEQFMRLYGNSNAVQVSSQTHNNHGHQAVQTESVSLVTAWTQCPINYGIGQMMQPDFASYAQGFGSADTDDRLANREDGHYLNDSIRKLNNFQARPKDNTTHSPATIDNIHYAKLNRFLQESSITISGLIGEQNSTNGKPIGTEDRYRSIRYPAESVLHHLKAVNLQAQRNLTNFLYTLHRDETNQLNTIAIWNVCDTTKPICMLSSWCNITCFEVHASMKSVVVAGLEDGSLAVWNLTEELFWHPRWNGGERRYAASQIVTPMLDNVNGGRCDYGKVVAVRCLYTNVDADLLNGYNPIQIFSLHEFGYLTLWTLIESSTVLVDDIKSNRIDHQSAWSHVKLNQSRCIDLRESIDTFVRKKFRQRPVSGFKKTQSYFENDLFNDAALKELKETNGNDDNKLLTKFTCVAMDISLDSIFIATNENFLLHARKSLRSNSFRKIQIDDEPSSRRYATTLLSMFSRDGDDILLAGLSDGAVKSYRILHSIANHELFIEDDESFLSFSSSALPSPHGNINNNNKFDSAASSSTNRQSYTEFLDADHLLGKSCAIQNIVTGERKTLDECALNANLGADNSEMQLALFGVDVTMGTQGYDNTVVRNLLNNQIVINGLKLNSHTNHSIRKLIHLEGQQRVFILKGSSVSVYNMKDNTETIVDMSRMDLLGDCSARRRRGDAIVAVQLDAQKVADIAVISIKHNEEFLVMLGMNNDITLHSLSK